MDSKDIDSVLLTLVTFIEYPFCNIIVKAVPRNLISYCRGSLAFSVISNIFVRFEDVAWKVLNIDLSELKASFRF